MSQPSRWEGWTLEYVDYLESRISFGKPLGDLTPREQDVILAAVGEGRFNAMSSYQHEVRVREALHGANDLASRCEGFAVTSSAVRSYRAYKHSETKLRFVDDVTEEQMHEIAQSMIAAGIIPVPRNTSGR